MEPTNAMYAHNNCANEISQLNNNAIQRVQNAVGMTDRDVKDAEANVRRDVVKSEADNARDIFATQTNLMNLADSNRNSADAQFLALNNRLCDQDKLIEAARDESVKQGYENRLLQKDTIIDSASRFAHLSERLSDKAEHYFEETSETLAEIKCCVCPKFPGATLPQPFLVTITK